MREKELRLAIICYGGVSLAIYMHGITKEIWHLARASCGFHDGVTAPVATETAYRKLLLLIETHTGTRLRILPDIIAGASAGGINGIFLTQAIAKGQSLELLTALWLDNADSDQLIERDARPFSAFSKFWMIPIAWLAVGRRSAGLDQMVSKEVRGEVRTKLSRFVRARWFSPPFSGAGFSALLLDAFDAMAKTTVGTRLLPADQPLDLFVTVTDFSGFAQKLRLNSPREIVETEHRIILSFRDDQNQRLEESAALTFAARATASFPGAFPPFRVAEIDGVLKARGYSWQGRDAFLTRTLSGHGTLAEAQNATLIDGSVLANAPFTPAINALRDRSARREVDRRFVYIDPTPTIKDQALSENENKPLPGFFRVIFAALSNIPREQPIRDSLEAIEARSGRIRRLQRIIDSLRPGVETAINTLFGHSFFLDSPTPARIKSWRNKAQSRAATDAGFAFDAYGQLKLSGIVDDIAGLVVRKNPDMRGSEYEEFRQSLWNEIRLQSVDQVSAANGKGAGDSTIHFFRAHDLGFRIRRLRFVIRTVANLFEGDPVNAGSGEALRDALFTILARYLKRETVGFYQRFSLRSASAFLVDIAHQRGLSELDLETDAALANALALCPKAERRVVLLAYLGFPFYDISTLPMLQGEGLDEFDPIKVDRISPEDTTLIRSGTQNTLKGIEFNNFGAFFSRAYRENDYLWGRLHGADRLFDIVVSSAPSYSALPTATLTAIKCELLTAILDEEEPRLTKITDLFSILRAEIAASAFKA